MPAALPGSTLAENLANPSAGRAVMFDPLSGPAGSPFDNDVQIDAEGIKTASGNASTGALSTGIGFGSPPVIAPASLFADGDTAGNFTDNYSPGLDLPSGTDATDSTLVYIGGGRCDAAAGDGIAPVNPYDETAVALCMAGNGGNRDGGSASPYTGFPVKTVTATGTVANGAAVETGFVNRSGQSITSGQSVFGSSTTPNAAPV